MMDDHFSRMLAPTETQDNAPSFLPAENFAGSRRGYIFQMNTQGLGYYLDPTQNCTVRSETEVSMVSTCLMKIYMSSPCFVIALI